MYRTAKTAGHPDFDTRVVEAILLGSVCVLPILLYLPVLHVPFERDEGVYATIARGILDGQLPYRDLFDNKPPLVYGWYALSFLLFGETVAAPRILAAVLLSFTTFFLFTQARLMFSKPLAYLIAVIFGLSTGLALVALNANSEAFMLLPLVASLVCFTLGMRGNGSRVRWFLLAGALNGLAIMTKQVAVWNVLALLAVVVVTEWRAGGLRWRAALSPLALLGGAAAAVAAVAVPFLLFNALDDFLYANVLYNRLWVGAVSHSTAILNLVAGTLFFVVVAAPLVAGLLLGLAILLSRRRWPWDYLLLFWTAASAVGVASGGRYFPHYFMHLLPAIAILTGLFLYERITSTRPVSRPLVLAGAGLVLVALVTNALLYAWPLQVKESFAEKFHEQAVWEEASPSLGEYIAQRTDEEDTIYVFGRETQLYFYADRRPAARYIYERPFWLDEEALQETLAALREAKPAMLIDAVQPPVFEEYADYHPPELRAFIRENYEYVGRVYFADVYRLKAERP